MSESFDDMLAHFGVRGMRWGTRKKSSSEKSSDGEKKKDGDTETSKKAADKTPAEPPVGGKKTSNKKQKAGDLTDVQLREAVNRLNMEKQYRELTKVPPGKLQAAQKFVADVVTQVAKQQAVALGNSHAAKLTAGLMASNKPSSTEKTLAKAKDTIAKSKTPKPKSTFLPPPASSRVG